LTTSRQRMLDAITYNHPDRIPVIYHGSPAGLHVHGQKLLDLFNRYPPDNPVTFDHLPGPPPDAVDAEGRYHEIRADEWGITWEYRIFGLWGHPKAHPLASWEEGAGYAFPPLPAPDPAQWAEQRREFLVFAGGISIFERLHHLRPMDQALMDIATRDPHLIAFLDRLVDYWRQGIARWLDAGADVITFADDWGTQTSSILSPALFRELFKPRYEALFAPIKRAGRRIMFHCCGYLGDVIEDFFDLGVDILWPQIGLFEGLPDIHARCKANGMSIYVHPDRQRLIPLGTPGEIRAAIRAYADRYHALGGGGLFYVEIENDAPFENVVALVESIDAYR